MTMQAAIFWRMSMERLQGLAATEGDHQDEAARVYIDRLCDMELQRRRQEIPSHVGWHQCSPGFGDGTGSSTVRREPLAEAYDRGEIRNSYWHNRARQAIATLPERKRAALMLSALKAATPREGKLQLTYDQMAATLGHFLQMLGWPGFAPMAPVLERDDNGDPLYKPRDPENEDSPKAASWVHPRFKNGQAIKYAAWEARVELLPQAKAGVI